MRRIGANFLITNTGKPLKNAYLELNDDFSIQNIVYNEGKLEEVSGLEFYNGVLVPGFVNTHCHLELSYLKGQIKEKKGLPYFIRNIQQLKSQFDKSTIKEKIKKADQAMQREGIVAVGDISNTADSIECKTQSPIKYLNFLELFAIDHKKAQSSFLDGEILKKQFETAQLDCILVPHAPYSVSKNLFSLIKAAQNTATYPISIHNQETESENSFFTQKSGELYEQFLRIGLDMSQHQATGKTALKSIIEQLPNKSNIILVHNTFTKKDDIVEAQNHSAKLFWALCPNANLYIENRLPDISLFEALRQNICVGTDSLASNKQLSILDELKTIQKHYPHIPFETLIKWASLNGAKALKLEQTLGDFEIGKRPGINLIENFDFEHFKLKEDSKIRVIA